jgi:hypothetical protein
MDRKKVDDLHTEFTQPALMNETRDYFARGRSLAGSSDSEAQSIWVATFEKWFDERGQRIRATWMTPPLSFGCETLNHHIIA